MALFFHPFVMRLKVGSLIIIFDEKMQKILNCQAKLYYFHTKRLSCIVIWDQDIDNPLDTSSEVKLQCFGSRPTIFETLQVKLVTLFYSHIFHGNVLSFSFSLSLELDHFCQMIVLTNDRRSNDLGFPAHLFMTRDDGSKLTSSSSYFSRQIFSFLLPYVVRCLSSIN